MEVEKRKSQSMTSAQQHVELDADHFQEVESRLAVEPGEGQQLMLLGGSPSHALPAPSPSLRKALQSPQKRSWKPKPTKKHLAA